MTSNNLAAKYAWGKFTAEDLLEPLPESQVIALYAGMRAMVFATFREAPHPRRFECTGHDGFILGAGGKIHQLRDWLLDHGHFRTVIGKDLLPEECRPFADAFKNRILAGIHAEILDAMLVMWRDNGNIWFLEDRGTWEFQPSLVEEYDRLAREAGVVFYNRRSWHGRHEKQGRRRAKQNRIAPGTSISVVSL